MTGFEVWFTAMSFADDIDDENDESIGWAVENGLTEVDDAKATSILGTDGELDDEMIAELVMLVSLIELIPLRGSEMVEKDDAVDLLE